MQTGIIAESCATFALLFLFQHGESITSRLFPSIETGDWHKNIGMGFL